MRIDSPPSPTVPLAAALGLVAGQIAIRANPDSTPATIVFVASAAVLAWWLGRSSYEHESAAAPDDACSGTGLLPRGVGGLGLALCLAGSVTLVRDWQHTFYSGWALLLVGIVVLSVGFRAAAGANRARIPWSRLELAGLALSLVVGAFLRFHQYGDFPGPFTTHAIEEQQTGLGGTFVLGGGRPWEFALDYQLTALALSFTDLPTFTTIRVPFTLASWLTIIAAHLLFRQLFRTPAALAGTFLFAAMSWNILYSRCAHPIFLSNLVVVATFAMLVHYGRTRRLAIVPWIGLASASTFYAYAGFRATPIFALLFLLGLLVARTRQRRYQPPGTWQRDAAAIALVLFVATLVAAPIFGILGRAGVEDYYFEAAERSLANRQYYTSELSAFVAQRFERIVAVARLFMHVGDGALTFNVPHRPMLDAFTAILFLPGLLLALLRPQRRYDGFFLFVLVVLLVGGTVFVQNLDVRRLQGITVLVAYFGAVLVEHAQRVWPARGRALAAALALGSAVAVSAASYQTYHIDMAGSAAARQAFRDHYTALIRFGREAAPGEIGLLSLIHRAFDRDFHYRANYAWLLDSVLTGKDLDDLHAVIATEDLPTPRTIAIQQPMEGAATAAVLRAVYPGTTCSDFPEADNPNVSLVSCTLATAAAARTFRSSLRARYWFEQNPTGQPDLERQEPFIGYVNVPRACWEPSPGEFCRAEWHAEREVPTGGETIVVEWIGRTSFAVEVDGSKQPPGRISLAPGRRTIVVRALLPKDWETGVRLSVLRDDTLEVLSFLR